VLDGNQQLVLGAPHCRRDQRHQLRPDRRGLPPLAQPRDELADRNAPQPGADVTIAPETTGRSPHRDEGVLQRLRREILVGRASPQPEQ
jgi:hypothetical protein